MDNVEITVEGMEVGFDLARSLARTLAAREAEEPMLISWCDQERGVHSPQCLKCEIKGEPGWEVYGRNHGGRWRISVNHERFVFIYG